MKLLCEGWECDSLARDTMTSSTNSHVGLTQVTLKSPAHLNFPQSAPRVSVDTRQAVAPQIESYIRNDLKLDIEGDLKIVFMGRILSRADTLSSHGEKPMQDELVMHVWATKFRPIGQTTGTEKNAEQPANSTNTTSTATTTTTTTTTTTSSAPRESTAVNNQSEASNSSSPRTPQGTDAPTNPMDEFMSMQREMMRRHMQHLETLRQRRRSGSSPQATHSHTSPSNPPHTDQQQQPLDNQQQQRVERLNQPAPNAQGLFGGPVLRTLIKIAAMAFLMTYSSGDIRKWLKYTLFFAIAFFLYYVLSPSNNTPASQHGSQASTEHSNAIRPAFTSIVFHALKLFFVSLNPSFTPHRVEYLSPQAPAQAQEQETPAEFETVEH